MEKDAGAEQKAKKDVQSQLTCMCPPTRPPTTWWIATIAK